MHIYGKNLQKFSMILKLGLQHQGQALQVYINDDPGLTLTYFMARSNWSPIRLNGENCYKVI